MECKYCSKKFTKKSNLQRHIYNLHDNKSVHHHGLTYADKEFIKRETHCFLHDGAIIDGYIFHCYACNFSICDQCMLEDCKQCNKNLCVHKRILIVIN